MAKRKLGVYSENTGISNSNQSNLQHQQDRLRNSLEHSKKSLVRALKLARGFERQKLGRRQKTAKESNEGLETTRRLDAEVSALKALDLIDIAESYIYKSMAKMKAISSAPGFPHYIISKLSSATPLQEPARSNVLARLFSSSVVKTSMADIMAGIEKILGINDAVLSKRKKRRRASDYANDTVVAKNHLVSVGTTISDEQAEPGLGNTHGVKHVPRTDYVSSNHKKLTSQTADSLRKDSANESFVQEMSSEAGDDKGNFYQQASLSSSHSSILSVPQTLEPRPQKASVTKPKCTTFLPSLSTGGYISNSDSDSDLLASLSEKIDIKPRKNRRGQQERRKIWEKKFGKNANHLKRQLENQSNDQDWTSRSDTRRKYNGSAFRRGGNQKSQNNSVKLNRGGPISSGANSDPVKARVRPNAKTESEKSLHPSWEAAKKAKETEKIIAFRGKKIVFN